jgi:hypothetical protein
MGIAELFDKKVGIARLFVLKMGIARLLVGIAELFDRKVGIVGCHPRFFRILRNSYFGYLV